MTQLSSKQLLEARANPFGGMVTAPAELPADAAEFAQRLEVSLKQWTADGYKAVWLEVPIGKSGLIPEAVNQGFVFHHSSEEYLMLTIILQEGAWLPHFATHYIGIGGVVLTAGAWGVLIVLMITVFLLGFFFDWIEITLIVLPVFAPLIQQLDFAGHVPYPQLTVAWFAILVAVNLQTSFLTPPFGFALFYMKGVAPAGVRIQHIYRGIVPFVLLQILGLAAVMAWPQIALWLPAKYGG